MMNIIIIRGHHQHYISVVLSSDYTRERLDAFYWIIVSFLHLNYGLVRNCCSHFVICWDSRLVIIKSLRWRPYQLNPFCLLFHFRPVWPHTPSILQWASWNHCHVGSSISNQPLSCWRSMDFFLFSLCWFQSLRQWLSSSKSWTNTFRPNFIMLIYVFIF